MAYDLEVGRDVLDNLGYVFAEMAQLAAAIMAETMTRVCHKCEISIYKGRMNTE